MCQHLNKSNYILFLKFAHFIKDIDKLLSATSKSKMEETPPPLSYLNQLDGMKKTFLYGSGKHTSKNKKNIVKYFRLFILKCYAILLTNLFRLIFILLKKRMLCTVCTINSKPFCLSIFHQLQTLFSRWCFFLSQFC